MVYIKQKDVDWGWGCVINFLRKRMRVRGDGPRNSTSDPQYMYIIDVMVHIKKRQFKGDKVEPAPIKEDGEMEVVPMLLETIQELSSVVLVLPNDLIRSENKFIVKESLREVHHQFQNGIPIMDPIKEMKITDGDLIETVKKIETFNKKIESLKSKIGDSSLPEQLEIYQKKNTLEKQARFLKDRLEHGNRMILEDDLKSMKSIMRTLNLINKEDIVLLKGRVAGEVSSCEELVVTELIFSGFFNNLQPAEIAAVMSCMVHDESGADKSKHILKSDTLRQAYEGILSVAKNLWQVYKNCKLNIDEQVYLNSFKPQLIEITYKWCEGASFGEICKLTDTYEGSIIRCFRRLEELLKELSNCARVMDNVDLQTKFNQASEKLKRGIVFAASLYIN
jgi:ATP-dependent RNA helicase DOB1